MSKIMSQISPHDRLQGGIDSVDAAMTARVFSPAASRPWYTILYVQVLIAISLGIAIGYFYPHIGVKLKPLGTGDRVRLKKTAHIHAKAFAVKVDEVASVIEAKRIPGQAPGGHLRLQLSSGKTTAWLNGVHFERAGVEENGDGPGAELITKKNQRR